MVSLILKDTDFVDLSNYEYIVIENKMFFKPKIVQITYNEIANFDFSESNVINGMINHLACKSVALSDIVNTVIGFFATARILKQHSEDCDIIDGEFSDICNLFYNEKLNISVKSEPNSCWKLICTLLKAAGVQFCFKIALASGKVIILSV